MTQNVTVILFGAQTPVRNIEIANNTPLTTLLQEVNQPLNGVTVTVNQADVPAASIPETTVNPGDVVSVSAKNISNG